MIIYKFVHTKSGVFYIGSLKHDAKWKSYNSSSKVVGEEIRKNPLEWNRRIIFKMQEGGHLSKKQLAIIQGVMTELPKKYHCKIKELIQQPIRYETVVMLEQMMIAQAVWKHGWEKVFNLQYSIFSYKCYAPQALEKRMGMTYKELLSAIHDHATRLNLVFTGRERMSSCGNRQYELKGDGFIKWYSHSVLKKVKDAHIRKPIELMLKKLAPLAKEKGVKLTGDWKIGGKDGYLKLFEIEFKGKKSWKPVKKLKAIKGKALRICTESEQFEQAQGYATAIGLLLTGNMKHIRGYRHFEVIKPNNPKDARWSVLSHLKEGKSPFTKPTLEQQLQLVEEFCSIKKIRFTGEHRKLGGQRNREFKCEVAPSVFRWLTLDSIKKRSTREGAHRYVRTKEELKIARLKKLKKLKKLPTTFEECYADAQNYRSRSEWMEKSSNLASTAYKRKWHAQCCEHMVRLVKPKGYWDFSKCKAKASKYDSIQAWRENDLPSYDFAKRQKWVRACMGHIEKYR